MNHFQTASYVTIEVTVPDKRTTHINDPFALRLELCASKREHNSVGYAPVRFPVRSDTRTERVAEGGEVEDDTAELADEACSGGGVKERRGGRRRVSKDNQWGQGAACVLLSSTHSGAGPEPRYANTLNFILDKSSREYISLINSFSNSVFRDTTVPYSYLAFLDSCK